MSHFLYIHKDLTNVPDAWKVGKTMTPYSAVRARQKFCWNQFGLQHLYFGFKTHITFIEDRVKQQFYPWSGKTIQKFGTQTEMFKVDVDHLLTFIDGLIVEQNLKVRKIEMEGDYIASNSGSCPFGIPAEAYAENWARLKCLEIFGIEETAYKNSLTTFSKIFSFE
jgi:hypothetical protein